MVFWQRRITVAKAGDQLADIILKVGFAAASVALASRTAEAPRVKNIRSQLEGEFVFLFSHLLDRLALGNLGVEKRDRIMNAVMPRTLYELAGQLLGGQPTDAERDAAVQKLIPLLDAFTTEYSVFPSFPADPTSGSKGTLIWEFQKHVGAISGHEMDYAFIGGLGAMLRPAVQEILKAKPILMRIDWKS